MAEPAQHRFGNDQHVKRDADFARIGRTGIRDVRGPLVFHATPGRTSKSRMGVRISRRCGTAPVRNRIKRLLREVFRLSQHDWPVQVDVVVTVRPHAPLDLPQYRELLERARDRLSRKLGERT